MEAQAGPALAWSGGRMTNDRMGVPGSRVVLALIDRSAPADTALAAAARLGLRVVARPAPGDVPLPAWPYAVEALADRDDIESFVLLGTGEAAAAAAVTAYVLPHRLEALGLVGPAPPAGHLHVDVAGITVPTVVAGGGRTGRWWAETIGAVRLDTGVEPGVGSGRLSPEQAAARLIRCLVAAADTGPQPA
jgi:pimeloyl-ACP methyl ester carboxylesterase